MRIIIYLLKVQIEIPDDAKLAPLRNFRNPRGPPKKIRNLIFSTLIFEKVKTLKEQKIILGIF